MLRQFKLLSVIIAFCSLTAVAQTIPATAATKHIGEQATVCGTISGEHYAASSQGTPTFINFERPYPKAPFTALVWGRDRAKVGALPSAGRMCVKGRIEPYKGSAEIVLHGAASWFVPKGAATAPPQLSNDNHYTNSAGQTVHSPAYSSGGVPSGATAQCSDGTYSFSQSRRGTCSHHGGVSKWL